ncbi:MAG: hypothetical protein AAFQ98_13280, partial [Bacteroidota bacterium]
IEHTLLRPRLEGQQLLDLQQEEPDSLGARYSARTKDPFSFRITVVLPRYGGRFREEGFRNYAEQLIRQETPAHIGVEIQWLDTLCGQRFETAYTSWLEAMKTVKPYWFAFAPSESDQPLVQAWLDAHNTLVDSLQVPCQPEIRALDNQGVRLPEVDGKIAFYLGDTDVFFLKTNQPQGRYTISKTAPEVSETHIDSEKQTTYVGANGEGLVTQLGGVGEYHISYESEDQGQFSPILISVTLPPDPRTDLSTILAPYAPYGRVELFEFVNNQPVNVSGVRVLGEFEYNNRTPEETLKRQLPNGRYYMNYYEYNSSRSTYIFFEVNQSQELSDIAKANDPAPPDLVARVGLIPYSTNFVLYPDENRHYVLQHNFQTFTTKHIFFFHPRQGVLTLTKEGVDTVFNIDGNSQYEIDMDALEEGTYAAVFESPSESPISFSFDWLYEKLDDIRFSRLSTQYPGGGQVHYMVRATMVEHSNETTWKVDGEVVSNDRQYLQTWFRFEPGKTTVTVEVEVKFIHLGKEFFANRTIVFTQLDVVRF